SKQLCLRTVKKDRPKPSPDRTKSRAHTLRIGRHCGERLTAYWYRSKVFQISYPDDMDDLFVLRDKVGHLREEIADIQKLNEQFRREGRNGADAQVADRQRNERTPGVPHCLGHVA